MADRNYYIMSGDTTVAKWVNNELTVFDNRLLPLYLKRVHSANICCLKQGKKQENKQDDKQVILCMFVLFEN